MFLIEINRIKIFKQCNNKFIFLISFHRNYWEFRKHFPDLAENLYASLDVQTQRAMDRERDGSESNGTNSMSASLRGSNSSLNSMPNSVISMCSVNFMFLLFSFCFVKFIS